MNTQEWLKVTQPKIHNYTNYTFQEIRPRVFCKDGFNISIQASKSHYSEPREDDSKTYTKVELGFPSSVHDLPEEIKQELIQYSDDYPELTTGTVYGYVPVELVNRILEFHKGIYTYQDFYRNMISQLMEVK